MCHALSPLVTTAAVNTGASPWKTRSERPSQRASWNRISAKQRLQFIRCWLLWTGNSLNSTLFDNCVVNSMLKDWTCGKGENKPSDRERETSGLRNEKITSCSCGMLKQEHETLRSVAGINEDLQRCTRVNKVRHAVRPVATYTKYNGFNINAVPF